MPAATLTEKGQVVIPAEIRARYDLTPGTQVEFVDEGGTIRLLVRRRIAPSEEQRRSRMPGQDASRRQISSCTLVASSSTFRGRPSNRRASESGR